MANKSNKSNKSKNRENQVTSNPMSRVTIVGEGLDEWRYRYLKLMVQGSTTSLPPYSMNQIISDAESLYTDLSNTGANIFTPKAKRQLLEALQDREQERPSFMVASHPGWHGRKCIVFPDKIFGKSKLPLERAFGDLDQQMLAKYRIRGTLQEWQEQIWRLCAGNSRLIFVMSLAVAPMILPLVKGPRSGGFQLYGPAETGKTAAAMAAGSFWGCHQAEGRRAKGFVESWHSTAGKIEHTGLAHNHALLIPDETKRAGRTDRERVQVVTDVAVSLSEHTERERLTNPASARAGCCYFLSTSNASLDELAKAGGIDIDDAVRGRMVDVPLPFEGFGLYETLHEFSNGEELTDAIKARSLRVFGTPRHAFAKKLVKDAVDDRRKLKRWLERRRRQYLKALKRELKKLKAAGIVLKPLKRASGRFATTFAAGSLAIKYGIFLLRRKELLAAILSCQIDGLRVAQEIADDQKSASSSRLRQRLIAYLNEHADELLDLCSHQLRRSEHKFGSVSGYVATFKGERWLHLTADQFKAIVGTGADASKLKKELANEGLMAKTKDRFVVQRPIFSGAKTNKGHCSVHAFRASILDRGDG